MISMQRASLLLLILALASSVRADDVTEGALAGRWKVVGTAPTAKNRGGLAELEKHGCYLYFEFAANGRTAVGIGSDSKAKLAALKKANPDVELEWSAKFEVVNGRVELSGYPSHLREPGGWLGDTATAIFRARIDGDTLELTGPGGFVAFQKVKKPVANETKTNPKNGANALVGAWRLTDSTRYTKAIRDQFASAEQYNVTIFGEDGTVRFGVRSRDGKPQPPPPELKKCVWKYRVLSETELEFVDLPPGFSPDFLGSSGGNATVVVKYALKGDTLTTEVPGRTETLTYTREK